MKKALFVLLILLLISLVSCAEAKNEESASSFAGDTVTMESAATEASFEIGVPVSDLQESPMESDLSKFYVNSSGFGGPFTIQLYDSGAFSYYEGYLSSHFGFGSWEINDDVLVLTELRMFMNEKEIIYKDCHYRFSLGEEELTFIKEDSDSFIYINLQDGTVFTLES